MRFSRNNSVQVCNSLLSRGKSTGIKQNTDNTTMKKLERAVNTDDERGVILHEEYEDGGFAAWFRNRNPNEVQTVTSDVLQEKYGIETTGYDPIPLPSLKV